jgi:adenosylhomocysteine nucleosidase
MSVDGRAAQPAGAASSVAVIVALGLERASFTRALGAVRRGVVVRQSGPGAAQAAAAASAAIAEGAVALVSCGLAGGLHAALGPGAVVIPRLVHAPDGRAFAADEKWRAAARAALAAELQVSDGDLVSVGGALVTPAAKQAAAASYGAVAVDMESAAIAERAAEGGVPFLVVRVVVDVHADTLPGKTEDWIDERGNRRAGAAVAAALKPWQWRTLVTLARRYRKARHALDRVAVLGAERGFFFESAV